MVASWYFIWRCMRPAEIYKSHDLYFTINWLRRARGDGIRVLWTHFYFSYHLAINICQLSNYNRPVWSASSQSARRKPGSLPTHCAHSEDSGQNGRMPRLIWVFAGRTVILLVLSWGSSNSDSKLEQTSRLFSQSILPLQFCYAVPSVLPGTCVPRGEPCILYFRFYPILIRRSRWSPDPSPFRACADKPSQPRWKREELRRHWGCSICAHCDAEIITGIQFMGAGYGKQGTVERYWCNVIFSALTTAKVDGQR